ncbi:disintegrin and metalloproteinase domain-containing protein 32, partial [Cricetulus griseus]
LHQNIVSNHKPSGSLVTAAHRGVSWRDSPQVGAAPKLEASGTHIERQASEIALPDHPIASNLETLTEMVGAQKPPHPQQPKLQTALRCVTSRLSERTCFWADL